MPAFRPSVPRLAAAFMLALLATAGAHAAPPVAPPPSAAISLTGAPEVSLTGAPSTPASAAPTAGEAALLGAWTEGLTASVRAQLATLPPEQALALRASLGDTLVFAADHTLRIYPRCAQAAQFGRAAVEGLSARWGSVDGRTLRVTSDVGGQARDRSTGFQVTGDELKFFESMASRPQVMGRYEGPLPPRCK